MKYERLPLGFQYCKRALSGGGHGELPGEDVAAEGHEGLDARPARVDLDALRQRCNRRPSVALLRHHVEVHRVPPVRLEERLERHAVDREAERSGIARD